MWAQSSTPGRMGRAWVISLERDGLWYSHKVSCCLDARARARPNEYRIDLRTLSQKNKKKNHHRMKKGVSSHHNQTTIQLEAYHRSNEAWLNLWFVVWQETQTSKHKCSHASFTVHPLYPQTSRPCFSSYINRVDFGLLFDCGAMKHLFSSVMMILLFVFCESVLKSIRYSIGLGLALASSQISGG